MTGKELDYIAQSVASGHISGNGPFTKKCQVYLEKKFGAKKVLLTTSCTAALEIAAVLCNVGPGDEIIMPSFTFVSTANAFLLRGARPVFVDINEDTLNINADLIEDRITEKTKVIAPIHYAGVACDMDKVLEIARRYSLIVIEDAAQAVCAKYKGRYLGTIADLGTYSFHESKNFNCGEGGALVINDERFIKRAETIAEKGTNRGEFRRGEVDKYTWVDIGSSYLPSDILAAYLYAQLEQMERIMTIREAIYCYYSKHLSPLSEKGLLRLPRVPSWSQQNYHMFYVLLPTQELRDKLIGDLKRNGILAVFHYVPLHTSPVGRKLGYSDGDFPVTENLSKRLLRLPLYNDLKEFEQEKVLKVISDVLSKC